MSQTFLNTFSRHYRLRYGQHVGKIPLDLGIQCPNRLKGGCIYCYAPAFSPGYLDKNEKISTQLERGKAQLFNNKHTLYLAYFQQETSTAVPAKTLFATIQRVLADEECVGVVISTRPDYMPAHLLSTLAEICVSAGKECLIELGLQSVHNKSLGVLNRNHSFADYTQAVKRIGTQPGLQHGAHLLMGIPGESEEEMLATVQRACELGAGHLKLHHLQVLYGTELYRMYLRGEYIPLSMEGYFELLLKIVVLIPEHVVIHRLWATSHPHMLAAPKWNILATELNRNFLERMEERGIAQGQLCSDSLVHHHHTNKVVE